MDTNPISSLLDNLRQKFTNPFLGTFILVWIVHNWRLVFSFFNFDERTDLERKMKVVDIYIHSAFSFWNLALCAVIAIGILIVTYAFMHLSRIIVVSSEKYVKPILLEIADTSKVVDRKELKDVEDGLEVWVNKYNKELEAKNAIQKRYDEMVEKDKKMRERAAASQEIVKDLHEDEDEQEIKEIYNQLNEEDLIQPIAEILPKILGEEYLLNSKATSVLMLHALIENLDRNPNGVGIRYRLSSKGVKFRNYLYESTKIDDYKELAMNDWQKSELHKLFDQMKRDKQLNIFEKLLSKIEKKELVMPSDEFNSFLLKNDIIQIVDSSSLKKSVYSNVELTESGKYLVNYYGHYKLSNKTNRK